MSLVKLEKTLQIDIIFQMSLVKLEKTLRIDIILPNGTTPNSCLIGFFQGTKRKK